MPVSLLRNRGKRLAPLLALSLLAIAPLMMRGRGYVIKKRKDEVVWATWDAGSEASVTGVGRLCCSASAKSLPTRRSPH